MKFSYVGPCPQPDVVFSGLFHNPFELFDLLFGELIGQTETKRSNSNLFRSSFAISPSWSFGFCYQRSVSSTDVLHMKNHENHFSYRLSTAQLGPGMTVKVGSDLCPSPAIWPSGAARRWGHSSPGSLGAAHSRRRAAPPSASDFWNKAQLATLFTSYLVYQWIWYD